MAPPWDETKMFIELRDITKTYGGNVALDSVSLLLEPGKVHALVGENGAGKSTCLGISGGHKTPTSGNVLVNGEAVRFGNVREAAARGIISIHQELSVIGELSAVQNVFLATEKRQAWAFTDDSAMRQWFVELSKQLEIDIDPDIPAGKLSVSDQQMLEIMKALVRDPRAVLFDEPTASLGPQEREKLYSIIDQLKSRGVLLAFVSHNLDEVLSLADTISVFRDGKLVRTENVEGWNRRSLTATMVGRDLEASRKPSFKSQELSQTPLMQVEKFHMGGGEKISFDVYPGEVVGIAGLVGSGRSNLLRHLAGSQKPASGELRIEGKPVPWPRSVRAARRLGIALLHEDRKQAGILAEATSQTNILLGNLRPVTTAGFVRDKQAREQARRAATQVGFKAERLSTPVEQLSGGNQQKTLLARLLLFKPRVILADEPARGVDVGAKEEIFDSLHDLAAAGSGVLMVSSEFEELEAHCSRVLVMWHGQIVAELTGDRLTRAAMITHSFGPEERAL